MSFKTDFPEFINGVKTYTIRDGKWSAIVKGEVVHVTQQGNQWKYSVKLQPLTFEEKQDYIQIVYDRSPTLATEIKTTALKDLLLFFRKKMVKSLPSKRSLPRILLDCNLETGDGDMVKVADYNYQYITISEGKPSNEFTVKLGHVILRLIKSETAALAKDNLYEIENWESVSASAELHEELKKLLLEEVSIEKELSTVS